MRKFNNRGEILFYMVFCGMLLIALTTGVTKFGQKAHQFKKAVAVALSTDLCTSEGGYYEVCRNKAVSTQLSELNRQLRKDPRVTKEKMQEAVDYVNTLTPTDQLALIQDK